MWHGGGRFIKHDGGVPHADGEVFGERELEIGMLWGEGLFIVLCCMRFSYSRCIPFYMIKNLRVSTIIVEFHNPQLYSLYKIV
jgi:hypothetical protein